MKSERIAHMAATLYMNGASIEQVAEKLHVSYRTARKAIDMFEIPRRGPSERLIGRTRPDKRPQTAAETTGEAQ